jgi:hypothetical protein
MHATVATGRGVVYRPGCLPEYILIDARPLLLKL